MQQHQILTQLDDKVTDIYNFRLHNQYQPHNKTNNRDKRRRKK
jgi:hypothetical protein